MADQDTSEAQKIFFKRADAHIDLANSHFGGGDMLAPVTGSMMFAASKFNAWMVAYGADNAEELESLKEETLKRFVAQYEEMLTIHLDDYVKNFDKLITQAK